MSKIPQILTEISSSTFADDRHAACLMFATKNRQKLHCYDQIVDGGVFEV